MPQFSTSLDLPLPVQTTFDYLVQPANVAALALPETHLRYVAGPERMHLGARLIWKGRRWGFSRLVVTEVTAFVDNALIIEEQRDGPLLRWLHERRFDTSGAGTRLLDRIDFDPPAGLLGRMWTVDAIMNELQRAFLYRDRKLVELASGAA